MVGIESELGRARQAQVEFRSHSRVEIRRSDFLTNPIELFDFIIGNPPYVSIYNFSENEKREFRATYETARGRFDLYLLFFERALKSLKPDGRMVFITPEKFLYVDTAAPLRRLLSRVQVEQIELVDERCFDGRVTYPTITTVINHSPAATTLVGLRDGTQRQCRLDGESSWMPLIGGAPDEEVQGFKLEDICIRVSCGVATGADDVFIRRTSTLVPELAAFSRPTIAGRDLSTPGEIRRDSDSAMLIPYSEKGYLLPERELGALGQYLLRMRERLMKRTCTQRKPWYAFHETPPLREILRPKIILKDITEKPYFWIDREGALVPRHSVYYIVPEDVAILDQLCRYLNSPNAVRWLEEHCQRAANGFLRLQSNVLKAMPIPDRLAPTLQRKPIADRRPQRPTLDSSNKLVLR